MNPLNDLPRHSPHSAPFDFALLACEDDIADRLLRLRRSLRLARADMAARMGVSVRDYCDFEDGFIDPGERAIAALAASTEGLSLKWLIHGRGLPFPDRAKETPPRAPKTAAMVGASAGKREAGAVPQRRRPRAQSGSWIGNRDRREEFTHNLCLAIITGCAAAVILLSWFGA